MYSENSLTQLLDRKMFYKYLIWASSVGIINIFCSTHLYLAYFWVGCQCLILTALFITKQYTRYGCYYLIFTSLSLEYDYYLGTTNYGFKSFEIFGLNLAIFLLLPIAGLCLVNFKSVWKNLKQFKYLSKFMLAFIMLSAIGTIIGFFNVCFNDNGIAAMDGIVVMFIISLYENIGLTLLPALAICYFLKPNKIPEFYTCTVTVLCGIAVTMVFSFLFRIFGTYGNGKTLFVTIASFYTPFILLLGFMSYRRKFRRTFIILGCISWALSFYYATMGKMVLIALLIPIAAVMYLIKKKTKTNLFMIFIILFIGGMGMLFILKSSGLSSLLQWKLSQAMDLLMFWKKDWLESMSPSPRTRIHQFIQITLNYLEHPYNFLFGKGILGTFVDYSGYLSSFKYEEVISAFSKWEWQHNVFFTVHETLNVLYLSNGLLGIVFLFFSIVLGLKFYKESVLLIIGLVWLLLFYSWSVTISVLGIACLIMGLIEIEHGQRQF